MMLVVPGVLTAGEVSRVRAIIDAADWIDGNATSGTQSALAKHNSQLPEASAAARAAGDIVLDALARSPLFVAAALPLRVYPPLFNRYGVGDAFDTHVDSAVRIRAGTDFRIRTDLSSTLFLCDPAEYDGGELIVEDRPGVKLPAGNMILYTASTLHRVAPVTRGTRVASFFWSQSMVKLDADRALLLELDTAIQALTVQHRGDDPALVRLTGVYHNLLRRCAEI